MKLKLTLILDENDAPDSTKTVDTPGGAVTLNAFDCGFTIWDVTPDRKPEVKQEAPAEVKQEATAEVKQEAPAEVKPVDNGVNA